MTVEEADARLSPLERVEWAELFAFEHAEAKARGTTPMGGGGRGGRKLRKALGG